MNLSDFATLAEAQAYSEVTDKKQAGSGQVRGFMVTNGIWTALRTIQADIAHPLFALADAVIVTASDAGSYFGLDPATAEGVANIASAQVLVDAAVMTAAQRDEFLAMAISTTNPHANASQTDFDEANDIGETIALAQNNAQHVLTLNVTTAPRKPTAIKVQQRFGASALDLTEWHDCGQFQNVQYTQRSYQAMIAGSPAAYRELRLVSPLTLGVSAI